MSSNVDFVGMKVDAFVLNTSVISDQYFVAPFNRPNHQSLLPGRSNLRHDFVPPVDIRDAYPWQRNPRIANVVTGEVLRSRLGIYLHWCVPKVFRTGRAATAGPDDVPSNSGPSRPGAPAQGSPETIKVRTSAFPGYISGY